jgi:chloramphenicol O-acetyltransferase
LVEKLSLTVNNGFEVVYNAMARNVSLADNIACTIKVLNVRVDSSGTPTSSLSFKIDTVGQIKGIEVIRAENQTNSNVYVTSHPFISYTQDNTTITVNNITGLPANNTFNLTVIAWA